MKLSIGLLAATLSLGIVSAPAVAQYHGDQGHHDQGRGYDGRDGHDRQYNNGNGHGRGYGHRGRRICRTERHHGHRETRCFYR